MSSTIARIDAARGGLLLPHDSFDTTQYKTNSGTDGAATMAAIGGRYFSGCLRGF